MKRKQNQEPEFEQGIYYPDGADSSYDLYLENKENGLFGDEDDELEGKLVSDILFVSEQFGLLRELYATIIKDVKYSEARIQWIKSNSDQNCQILKIRTIEDNGFSLFMPDDITVPTNWMKKYSKYGDLIQSNGLMFIIRHVVDQDGKDIKSIPGVIGFYTLSHEIVSSTYDGKWRNWVKKIIIGQCANPEALYGAIKEYEFRKGTVWPNPDYRPAKNEKISISALKDEILPDIYTRLEQIINVHETLYLDKDLINAIITLNETYKKGKEKNATPYSFKGKTVNVCIPYSIYHETKVLCDILGKMIISVGANNAMTIDQYDNAGHVNYKVKLSSEKMGQLVYDLVHAPLVE